MLAQLIIFFFVASRVVVKLLEYFTLVGDAYVKVGQVGKKLATNIDRHFGSLNKKTNTYDVNLPELTRLIAEAVDQLKYNLNVAKIRLENLIGSFSGPYKTTQIPVA